ncbi:hypothetical protein [Timonella senegalensis]|uniref:hypothetical protein n=1 Tax=Timonella senegalensis TaxID=1465825 RepID=UPI0002EA8D09|nr:hypothetical protein [Timonella senegalensis]
MTITTQAIEAGAKNLLARGTIVPELRQAKGDWGAAGFIIQEEFLDMSRAVLTAALPALEQQIREHVTQELAAEATRLEQTKHHHDQDQTLADALILGVRHSAKLARGKEQP